jgi:hypothetical protein
MVRPLMGTLGEAAGLVPAAMMNCSARTSIAPSADVTPDGVWIENGGVSREHFNVVAVELRDGDVDFGADHILHAEDEIRLGNLFLGPDS